MTEYESSESLSQIFFDVIFSLIFYIGADSFFVYVSFIEKALVLLAIIISIHWWLQYRCLDSKLGPLVTESLLDFIIGIIEVFIILYLIYVSEGAEILNFTLLLILLFLVDTIWAIIWQKATKSNIVKNTFQLDKMNLLFYISVAIVMYIFNFYSLLNNVIGWLIIVLFYIFYIGYFYLSLKKKIIYIGVLPHLLKPKRISHK